MPHLDMRTFFRAIGFKLTFAEVRVSEMVIYNEKWVLMGR
jgi:hypothetical protein